MIYYGRQSVAQKDIQTVAKILRSDFLTQGPIIKQFEDKVAHFCQAQHAIAVNSGTAALHAAMFAIGLTKGDEVITSPLSFVASSNSILYMQAKPVFADINKETGLLDPEQVERKISKRTKAILTVDYSGNPSYFKELRIIANKYKLLLIDDASHSFGARYFGKPVGTQADVTTFSFHPVKIITTGEGGIVITDNRKFAERAFLFRTHGITKLKSEFVYQAHKAEQWYYEMQDLGFNYRITDFQCALGISQLYRIKQFIMKRRILAQIYTESLRKNSLVSVYQERDGVMSSWHLYPLRISSEINKIKFFQRLYTQRISLQVHYIPIHLQPFYRKTFGYKPGDFPVAEHFYQEEVSLPLYYDLSLKQAHYVVDTINATFSKL